LDSSAVAKRYVIEQGSAWITNLFTPAGGVELAIVRITAVEVAAALFRRTQAGSLAVSDAIRALTALRRHMVTSYQVYEVSAEVCESALDVAQGHGLRGYDCVQLATALHVQRLRAAARLGALTLVSADLELNAAASAEGIAVEDPNHHS
jgi:predicted nucleic acid-binding protein